MPLKSPNFSKGQVLDGLSDLDFVEKALYKWIIIIISKERNHDNAEFYSSVFQGMSKKAAIPDDDFKEYLEVLLGNKDKEKVMELLSKAETAMRNSRLKRRDNGYPCYTCGGHGHFQATC